LEADHIDLWHSGGKIKVENRQMLYIEDNRIKSGKIKTVHNSYYNEFGYQA
jgi:hypothetical protein